MDQLPRVQIPWCHWLTFNWLYNMLTCTSAKMLLKFCVSSFVILWKFEGFIWIYAKFPIWHPSGPYWSMSILSWYKCHENPIRTGHLWTIVTVNLTAQIPNSLLWIGTVRQMNSEPTLTFVSTTSPSGHLQGLCVSSWVVTLRHFNVQEQRMQKLKQSPCCSIYHKETVIINNSWWKCGYKL